MNIIANDVSSFQKGEMPVIAIDMPIMYEDEGQEQMGEAEIHLLTDEIVRNGIKDHLVGQERYRVFSNLNVYYHPIDRWAYVSPDTMVAEPFGEQKKYLTSYRIGVNGPAPTVVVEVLSRRSFQQQDLTEKPIIYSQLGVPEYILVDVTGDFLHQLLLLKQLQPDGAWLDLQDPDGGVTSRLGFRLVIEPDGGLRVTDAATGKRYLRPRELHAEADALALAKEREAQARALAEERAEREAQTRALAEERAEREADRARELEAELARLRVRLGEHP